MSSDAIPAVPVSPVRKATRIHYLDWLRVLAIMVVFLFHAVHAFDLGGWHIKNAEQSETLSIILTILGLWGMPFFFLVAGAASNFALRRRTPGQYVSERVKRLMVPYFVGLILFTPIQLYLEYLNKVQLSVVSGSFQAFLDDYFPPFEPTQLAFPGWSPVWIATGLHLWFLGFLFLFALFTLPLLIRFNRPSGRRVIDWVAAIADRRGGLLVFVLPLLVITLGIKPLAPREHDWGDFIYLMAYFILGFILYADARFERAIRRDWGILLGTGLVILLALFSLYLLDYPVAVWGESPAMTQYYFVNAGVTAISLGFTLSMVYVGMRFLDFQNQTLRYAREAVLPFFLIHQPVIIVIAFFVVQWLAGIPLKMAVVVFSSFAVCLLLYEYVIRRVGLLRSLFGMTSKPTKPAKPGLAT